MGRKQQYGSKQERQAAWRARRRLGAGGDHPRPVPAAGDAELEKLEGILGMPARQRGHGPVRLDRPWEQAAADGVDLGEVEFEGVMTPVKRVCSWPLEEYIKWSTAGVRDPDRLERAIKYARWRYAGWQVKAVANLI